MKKVKDLSGNPVNMYRKSGNSLYIYTKDSDAYVCCYTGTGRIEALIDAYENCENFGDES